MSELLKPCPLCGNAAAFIPDPPNSLSILQQFRVGCTNLSCLARGPSGPNKAAVIAAWNTRPAEATVATLTAEVARLRALLGEFVADEEKLQKWMPYSEYSTCIFCGAIYQHESDCLVLHARAALAPEETL